MGEVIPARVLVGLVDKYNFSYERWMEVCFSDEKKANVEQNIMMGIINELDKLGWNATMIPELSHLGLFIAPKKPDDK